MIIAGTATDVITYFVMRLTATGVAATGLTPANFDLTWVQAGETAAAKQDAVVNPNGIGGAWAPNTVIEVDAANMPGLYRVDWPDAAFTGFTRGIHTILTVKCATAFTEHLRIDVNPPVNMHMVGGDESSASDLQYMIENGSDGTHWFLLPADLATISGYVAAAHVTTDALIVSSHVTTDALIVSSHVTTDADIATLSGVVTAAHVATDADIAALSAAVTAAHVATDADIATLSALVVSEHVTTDALIVSSHATTDGLIGGIVPGAGAGAAGAYVGNLIVARDNLTLHLAQESADPRPNYTVGGRSVAWSEYRTGLVAQIKELNLMVIKASGAVEIRTIGLS